MKTFIILLALVLVVASCGGPSPTENSLPTPPASESVPAIPEPACTAADCVIETANACEDADVTLKQAGGTFRYSTTHCLLTKTLVALDPADSPEMKSSLEGKSLSCAYTQGSFDARWVNSLFYGLETCTGELKDKLAWLLMLT